MQALFAKALDTAQYKGNSPEGCYSNTKPVLVPSHSVPLPQVLLAVLVLLAVYKGQDTGRLLWDKCTKRH